MSEKAQRVQKVLTVRASDMPQGTTAQPGDDGDRWTPDHAIDPPANLDQLANLTQVARTRRSCIEAVTLNTVGRGFRIVPREGSEETDEEEITQLQARLDAMARRDSRLGRPSLARLLSAVKWDEEEVGNGYLEVSRNKLTGEIDGLFHVPGKRVRRRADRKGYVMGAPGAAISQMTEFYDFGTKVKYDAQGRPQPRLEGNGKRWERNELIPFRIYTSESRDYGLPRDSQLALDYLGDSKAAQSNVSFFDATGVPPTIIFVKPPASDNPDEEKVVQVPPEVTRQIADSLSADSSRRHRVAVISLPEGVEPDKVDLASLSDRDMNFIEFRRDNRRATLGAFRLAPIFVADIEDTNYSTAETEERLTKKQLFDPEQDRWEDILSDSLLRDLGFPHLRFDLVPLEVGDEKERAESADALADREAITNGELRRAHGHEPLPEAEDGKDPEPGQVEHGWNGRLVTVTVAKGGDQEIQRGAEAAARLLAEGQAAGHVGIEAGG